MVLHEMDIKILDALKNLCEFIPQVACRYSSYDTYTWHSEIYSINLNVHRSSITLWIDKASLYIEILNTVYEEFFSQANLDLILGDRYRNDKKEKDRTALLQGLHNVMGDLAGTKET